MHRTLLGLALAAAALAAADAFAPAFSVGHGLALRPSLARAPAAGHRAAASPLPVLDRSRRAMLRGVQPSMIALGGLEAVKALPMPAKTQSWEVHKFGGASLANAGLYRTVGDLLISESEGRGDGRIPTMAIVSAMYGVTDQLISCVDAALISPDMAKERIEEVVNNQISTIRELATPEICEQVEKNIRKDADDVINVLKALSLIKSTPAVVMELITGLGEVWSAQTLLAYLKTKDVPCQWIDAREILVVSSTLSGLGEKGSSATGGVTVQWEESSQRMVKWWETQGKESGMDSIDYSKQAPIVVVTGFVASTPDGVPTTLKRSGSDFSATIFARLIEASRVTMWKNTDGIYTADPRRVPDAFPIASLKYDEAMELAYFGAQVLHPSAMVPCIDANIPVYVRNIFNPAFEGSVIQGRCLTLRERDLNQDQKDIVVNKKGAPIPIKGITSIDKIAVLNLEGASIIGLNGAASRFFGAMASADVNIIMITQASSEHSICVAVPEDQGERALRALQSAFELELERSTINSVSLLKGMSVVAIVGEGMAFTPGVSATFMKAISTAGVNIRAIAQGSSERQVSAVVERHDVTRALRSVHNAFTLSSKVVSVAVIGCTGVIGKEFIAQLGAQAAMLKDKIDLQARLVIAADSNKMVYDENGLSAANVDEKLEAGEDLDLQKITSIMGNEFNPTRVVIDLTASEEVADYYEKWLSRGIHVVTASKKVGAGPVERYNRVKTAALSTNAQMGAECSVGAALPVISTIRDLMYTGDDIERIEGVWSGTMTYIANRVEEGSSLDEALQEAVERGYTEPDLRNDLSGLDVAKKLVIIGRELGMTVDVEDVYVESFIPDDLKDWKCETNDRDELASAFIAALKGSKGTSDLAKKIKAAGEKGLKVRQVGTIDLQNQQIRVEIQEVTNDTRFGSLKIHENAIQIYSRRYNPQPLVIRGAGAGSVLTASGVFAELLRVSRSQ